MTNRSEEKPAKPLGSNEADKLSALNIETKRRRDSAQKLRRRMEASIEANAKKRRKREVAASAAWKP